VSIANFRAGIAANIATIPGLRTSLDIPEQINPPIAVIGLESADYDGAFQGGLTEYTFLVTVIASRASGRAAQNKLDAFVSTGASSIKKAIESDKSLGGNAFDVRVTRMSNIGTVSLGEVSYLAADFTVTVFAN
jgi:hypothetical protein